MKDLIEALTILLKYGNPDHPTHCEHDIMYVYAGVHPDEVSEEDKERLDELGFFVEEEFDCFASFKYGSC